MRDFREMKVWQKAHELTLQVYRASSRFPPTETYGITSLIRRAACSIPANICEGCGREANADFARFLRMAMGSAFEVEYFLILSRDLALLEGAAAERLLSLVSEIKRMLTAFIAQLGRRVAPRSQL